MRVPVRGWLRRHAQAAALCGGLVLLLVAGFLTAIGEQGLGPQGDALAAATLPERVVGTLLTPLAPIAMEPPNTAAFFAAYTHGDAAAVERVASPLYGLEWARRGVDARARATLFPQRPKSGDTGSSWIRLTSLGGFSDAHGFRHLLYAGGPPCERGCFINSVWRLDTEPSGRVIWVEMVWLVSSNVSDVVAEGDGGLLPTGLLPDDLAVQSPRLVMSVHADGGPEGYYAVKLGSDARRLAFFTITPHGDVRPGTWSYGRPLRGPGEADGQAAARAPRPTSQQEALRRAYLASLE